MDKPKAKETKAKEPKAEETKAKEPKAEETKAKTEETEELDKLVQEYIATFTPEQKKVHEIAIRILESSYSVEKSIGFLEFKKLRNL